MGSGNCVFQTLLSTFSWDLAVALTMPNNAIAHLQLAVLVLPGETLYMDYWVTSTAFLGG